LPAVVEFSAGAAVEVEPAAVQLAVLPVVQPAEQLTLQEEGQVKLEVLLLPEEVDPVKVLGQVQEIK